MARSSDNEEGQRMKVREILEMLRRDGWYLVATRGSHRQFKHPAKTGRVTVPGKPGDDLPPGLLNSILKQSGLKR
jgi:predicted RNA binding protein YcfA (HicA-like mRNA interferase family)